MAPAEEGKDDLSEEEISEIESINEEMGNVLTLGKRKAQDELEMDDDIGNAIVRK